MSNDLGLQMPLACPGETYFRRYKEPRLATQFSRVSRRRLRRRRETRETEPLWASYVAPNVKLPRASRGHLAGHWLLPFWQPVPAAKARACQNVRHGGPRFPNNPRVFTLSRHLARALLHFVNICKLIILLRGSGPLPEGEGSRNERSAVRDPRSGCFDRKTACRKMRAMKRKTRKSVAFCCKVLHAPSRSRYRTMQKSRQERCSFDSWLRAGLHLHAPGRSGCAPGLPILTCINNRRPRA